MPRVVIFLFSCFLLFGCSESPQVYFKSAQPENKSALKKFGRNIKGVYRNCTDSTKSLEISDNQLLITKKQSFKVEKDKLGKEKNISITSDSNLESLLELDDWQITLKNDTVFGFQFQQKSLFTISNKSVAKKSKTSYYLNNLQGNGFWEVLMVQKKNDTLFFGKITPTDALMSFNYSSLKKDSEDTSVSHYILSPTKENLKDLSKDFFTTYDCYIKQK